MAFFQCKYAFSNQNMTFYINKRRRKTPYMAFSMQIRLFRCLSEGVSCRWYVLNFKHFWIRSRGKGGVRFFNNFWDSKYSELSQIFQFFLVTPPLRKFEYVIWLRYLGNIRQLKWYIFENSNIKDTWNILDIWNRTEISKRSKKLGQVRIGRDRSG